jgi:hypothetical protein
MKASFCYEGKPTEVLDIIFNCNPTNDIQQLATMYRAKRAYVTS